MSDLRTAAQQALGRLRMYYYGTGFAEDAECIAALERALARKQAERVCKCDLRTRLVGDGCEVCNPELAAELAQERAEPVQEPVYWEVRCTAHPKWMRVDEQQFHEYVSYGWEGQRLYTAPPQRKPLAEWQINDLMADIDPEDVCSWSFRQGVYAAEKHHGVKL